VNDWAWDEIYFPPPPLFLFSTLIYLPKGYEKQILLHMTQSNLHRCIETCFRLLVIRHLGKLTVD
jgi:hypothetical protein